MFASKHGGDLQALAKEANCLPEEIIDFSANINPLAEDLNLKQTIFRYIDEVEHYPDPRADSLKGALAKLWDKNQDEIVIGNGSNELFYAIARLDQVERVVICEPCYADYQRAAEAAGKLVYTIKLHDFNLDEDLLSRSIRKGDAVFIGYPNNPTGKLFNKEAIVNLVSTHPEVMFVIDEAFIEFAGEQYSLISEQAINLVVVRSFTKFYGIPGLRLGACISTKNIAEEINKQIPDWSVNGLAQKVGLDICDKKKIANTLTLKNKFLRELFASQLEKLNLFEIYPSDANFLLCRLKEFKGSPNQLRSSLLKQYKIAIRDCSNFSGLDEYTWRLAVRGEEDQNYLIESLRKLTKKTTTKLPKRKATTIMFQGTASNVGKSMMTSALCRVLKQDGYNVAPFKSQNMSNNSYVTKHGEEVARAQVVQAQACGLDPDVRFSPVLLKPTGDMGSQVIVSGKPLAHLEVKEYYQSKEKIFNEVKDHFESLRNEFDVIVMEGAGSAAEINLKKHDIVNMNMAKVANTPVVLVGDIFLGGIYASFLGSYYTLEKWEKNLLKGFLVNRFRGDASLLTSAHDTILQQTGKPVIGVMPDITNLDLPEEDSVNFKDESNANLVDKEKIDIALIDLPHISNFTDFDALKNEALVCLRKVKSVDEFLKPDVVIIPGSKNTLTDLKHLKDVGLFDCIINYSKEKRGHVVGICGGYQMLGDELFDPYEIESKHKKQEGMKLLTMRTTLLENKTLQQTTAKHLMSSSEVIGYEIHHGESVNNGLKELFKQPGLGLVNKDGTVWGSYLHGIFDNDDFRHWFVKEQCLIKGIDIEKEASHSYDLEPEFDKLASVFREHVDLKYIKELLKLT